MTISGTIAVIVIAIVLLPANVTPGLAITAIIRIAPNLPILAAIFESTFGSPLGAAVLTLIELAIVAAFDPAVLALVKLAIVTPLGASLLTPFAAAQFVCVASVLALCHAALTADAVFIGAHICATVAAFDARLTIAF